MPIATLNRLVFFLHLFMNPNYRRYHCTRIAKQKGFLVNGYQRTITIYFDEIHKLFKSKHALELVQVYGFTIGENKQLKIEFND